MTTPHLADDSLAALRTRIGFFFLYKVCLNNSISFVRYSFIEMSNTHLFMPSGFIRTPLKNGLGRFVPQLQRITLKFCKSHGGSRGVRYKFCSYYMKVFNFTFVSWFRDFIESDLMDFAKKNPGTVVYLKPRRHRSACMVAEYCKYFQNFVVIIVIER